jgi:DNA-binding PadR family transcriptional regulator
MPSNPVPTINHKKSLGLTSLELLICSFVDRGLRTAYDLHRQAGLSIGSTIPALTRLETSGLLKKQTVTTGDRRSNSYRLSPTGRKLARTAWRPLLEDQSPRNIEDVLRVVELANHYGAPVKEIAAFLHRAAEHKDRLAKQSAKDVGQPIDKFAYRRTRSEFETVRLIAESKFLQGCADSFDRDARKRRRNADKRKSSQ